MTYTEFISKYNGKATNYDDSSGVQCVDLIKAYLNEVFGIGLFSIGVAANYFDKYDDTICAPIKENFYKINYQETMQPQKGDIIVWSKALNGYAGHVAIATGEGTDSYFYSYDQNWNVKACTKVKHPDYHCVSGFLRPKDQTNITGSGSSGGSSSGRRFPTPVAWKNGSTTETVYKVNDLTDKIGSLSPYESALCYSKSGNSYVVLYTINGTNAKKVGFVGYAGGVSYGPPESKEYKNGSTSETVYADTAKSMIVGSLDPYETCYGLGYIGGMYLVLYKINGTNKEKCGFVSYSGGC